jgi:hypothetical protein
MCTCGASRSFPTWKQAGRVNNATAASCGRWDWAPAAKSPSPGSNVAAGSGGRGCTGSTWRS